MNNEPRSEVIARAIHRTLGGRLSYGTITVKGTARTIDVVVDSANVSILTASTVEVLPAGLTIRQIAEHCRRVADVIAVAPVEGSTAGSVI